MSITAERIGLIDPVPRDGSSGHRRYPSDLVAAIETLSCLRSTGMSVRSMHAYVVNMRRGAAGAAYQRRLFADHAERLRGEIERLQLREHYVSTKAEMWAAREHGGTAAEAALTPTIVDLITRLRNEEANQSND
jgi:MerR family transcriptional regulator, aldehyde-responsive regulator